MNMLIPFLGMLLCVTALFAEESWQVKGPTGFAAEAILTENKVLLPQPVNIQLRLTFPPNYHVDEKGLLENLLRSPKLGPAPFVLTSLQHEKAPADVKGVGSELWRFQLEPQLAGKQALTFLNISFLPDAKGDGKAVDLVSGLFWIEVELPKVREVYFPPIEAQLNLSGEYPVDLDPALRAAWQQQMMSQSPKENRAAWAAKRFPWEAAIILAALLLAGLYLKLVPRKKPAAKQILRSQLFYKQAEEKLQALQQQPDAALAGAFIVDLSNAVRAHFEETYQLNVLPETTEEFFAKIDADDTLNADKRTLLKEFIQHADRVKFALHTPSLEECLAAQQTAAEILSMPTES